MTFGSGTESPPKKKSLGNIHEDQLNSSQQVTPITYLAGQRLIAGHFGSPCYNQVNKKVKRSSGKGSSGSETIEYKADQLFIMCMGGRQPVDGVFKFVQESEIIWQNGFGLLRDVDPEVTISIPDHGTAYLAWGAADQPADTHVLVERGVLPAGVDPRDKSTWPANNDPGVENTLAGHYDRHPRYINQCRLILRKWHLGTREPFPQIMLELRRSVPWFDGVAVDRAAMGLDSDLRGVNPIGFLFDICTDDICMLRQPESSLHLPSFEDALAEFAAQDFRIAPTLTKQDRAGSVLRQLYKYCGIFPREYDGKFGVGFFSKGPINLGALPVLTDDDLDGEPELKPSGFGAIDSTLVVRYSDRFHFYNDTPQKFDLPNARRRIGEAPPVVEEREWITDPDIAKRWVTEEGVHRSRPGQAGPMPVKREWLDSANVREGDRFLWQSASRGLSLVVRLLEIEWPEDRSGRANLEIENERSEWPSLYIPPPDTSLGDFYIEPIAIVDARDVLLPEGLKEPGQFFRQLAVLAQRPRLETVGFNVWTSTDNATFDVVSRDNRFAARGELVTAYAAGVNDPLVIDLYGADLDTVTSQSAQAQLDDTLLLFLGAEIFSVGTVTALGNGRFSIAALRGRYNTAPAGGAPHPVGADCWFIRRDAITPIEHATFLDGTTRYFKLQPYTALEVLDIAGVTSIAHVFPAAPAAPVVKSTGSYSVDLGGGVSQKHLTFSWSYSHTADIAQFEIQWRSAGEEGLENVAFQSIIVAEAGTLNYDIFGYPTEKVQSYDLALTAGASMNYDVRVRSINTAGDLRSEWGGFSRKATASSSASSSDFNHFTSQAELENFLATVLPVNTVVFVTIAGHTHFRQLQNGAPDAAVGDWTVFNQPTMRWRQTGGFIL